ncbi:MAG: tmRNA-binding protein SmpB, partial [uncultured Thermomicrobiales bacterium]
GDGAQASGHGQRGGEAGRRPGGNHQPAGVPRLFRRRNGRGRDGFDRYGNQIYPGRQGDDLRSLRPDRARRTVADRGPHLPLHSRLLHQPRTGPAAQTARPQARDPRPPGGDRAQGDDPRARAPQPQTRPGQARSRRRQGQKALRQAPLRRRPRSQPRHPAGDARPRRGGV